jgi:alpha-tubulin suppressor-like RCC1 family protein
VYCWGANERGQLGQGDRQSRSRPSLVPLPSKTVQLASHFSHVCARTESDVTYCWGDNFEGALGQGDAFPASDARAADGLSPVELPGEYQHISPGQGHTCGVRTDGSLWCWGRNSRSELAVAEPGQVRSALRIGEESGWQSAYAGQAHSCALREPGTLWCWGENSGSDIQEGSPLGLTSSGPYLAPTQITDSDAWTDFGTNTFHSCGLRGAELWCWGRNIEGQLGTGDIDLRPEPTRIGDGFARVSVGRFHTCALTTSNQVQCSGKNEAGELGSGDLERRREFTTLDFE